MGRRLLASLVTLLVISPLCGLARVGAQQTFYITTPPLYLAPPGLPIGGDVPVVGDWQGDGKTSAGIVANAHWVLQFTRPNNLPDWLFFFYGLTGDRPVTGDWDGNGTTTVGVRRGAEFFLRNSNSDGIADLSFTYGLPSDLPVTGDWDGDGTTTVGVYRQGTFYLRNSNTTGPADIVVTFGLPVDQPVVGDWDGNGTTTIGVYRGTTAVPGGATFYWRNSNTTGPADGNLLFGLDRDAGLAGDWDGNGVDSVGIRRDTFFYLSNSLMEHVAGTGVVLGSTTYRA